jgi:hypothetical protein
LRKIQVYEDTKQALIHPKGPLSEFLKAVAYEKCNSEECIQALENLQGPKEQSYAAYLSSIELKILFQTCNLDQIIQSHQISCQTRKCFVFDRFKNRQWTIH